MKIKNKIIIAVFFFFIICNFVSSSTDISDNYINTTGNITSSYYFGDGSGLSNIPSSDNASWNESYADTKYILQSNESNLNVNSSNNWDNLDTINLTQMEDAGGTLNIQISWFSAFFDILFGLKTTDDLPQGILNFYDNRSFNQTLTDGIYYGIDNPYNFYNLSDFDIADYYLNSNPFNFLNSTSAGLIYAPINYGDDWNKTYADTLYSGIEWNYNQSSWLISIYGDNWYNHTASVLNLIDINQIYNHTSVVESLYGKWFYNQSDGSYNKTYDSKNSSQWTTSGSNIYYNSGNVGIGTSSPVAKFVVNGTDKFNVNPDQGATSDIPAGTLVNPLHDLTFATGVSVGDQFTIVYRDDGGSRWNSALEVNSVASGNGNLLLMKGGGNVGIGETSPGAILHITDADTGQTPPSTSNVIIEDTATSNYMSFLDSTANAIMGILFTNGSINNGYLIYDTDGKGMRFQSGNDEVARLVESGGYVFGDGYVAANADPGANNMVVEGNVGIGTSSPNQRLEVSNTGSATPLRIVDSSNTCDFGVDGSGWASISCSSDEKLKEDIHEVPEEKLKDISDWVFNYPLKEYTWKSNNETAIGAIAQDIQNLSSDKVKTKQEIINNQTEDVLFIETPTNLDLIIAIQKLNEENSMLKNELCKKDGTYLWCK